MDELSQRVCSLMEKLAAKFPCSLHYMSEANKEPFLICFLQRASQDFQMSDCTDSKNQGANWEYGSKAELMKGQQVGNFASAAS